MDEFITICFYLVMIVLFHFSSFIRILLLLYINRERKLINQEKWYFSDLTENNLSRKRSDLIFTISCNDICLISSVASICNKRLSEWNNNFPDFVIISWLHQPSKRCRIKDIFFKIRRIVIRDLQLLNL